MNNSYAYTGTFSTSSTTSMANILCPAIFLAGIASIDYQPHNHTSTHPAKSVKYSSGLEVSETVNPSYYVNSLGQAKYNHEESYFKEIFQKFSSAQESGFVDIPKNIETADDFYAWLHK